MPTFKNLKDEVLTTYPATGTVAALHLDHEKAVVPAITSLSKYYKEYDPDQCVELILHGQKAGCLSIKTVHRLSMRYKGFGGAYHIVLGGPPPMEYGGFGHSQQAGPGGDPKMSIVLFQCPKDSTEFAWAVIPPMCEKHDVPMEEVK
ncbi:MAG: hypothetical protein ABSF90_29155 [Syntrophobacteraceae bacterium]|jgi:hypothetical protein